MSDALMSAIFKVGADLISSNHSQKNFKEKGL